MDKEHIVNQVKLLIPNNNKNPDYDKIIDFTVDKIMNDIANYCNIPIDELPNELSAVAVSMAVQAIKVNGVLDSESAANIQSLNEGDVSVTFKPVSDIYVALQGLNPITDNYTNILNNFRRLPE
ncbi:MAG: hypothetical protein DQL95_04885 [Lactobacillus helveticus]|uniref:hypothetical protein n=1 Tax=Lactobacillus phage phiAQ113 TaxID=1206110 RepID=UPI00029FCA19|nr:hypothetical protein BN107_000010 [Lactobacillus phage phiAQ113]AZA19797.1 MAG: hypothetical protein DQL95_04885 [Lactobacillus helveticus]WFD52901.1 hypothetical protein [Lactobacillus phage CR191]WFD52998.1 hypothetical protein [Lactobacillus phage P185]WFD53035.1 hypothetical protein [Lactobacillus phage S16]WFD53117.1 hypothetical protein [Lactobacillus phage S193]WFD53178.1 hypothetical protein [Lactobacillus phage T280]WFF43774.1 sheat tail protein [Lactobacillus phage CR28]